MRVVFAIYRLDNNPGNQTFGRWCYMTEFPTIESAEAFKRRASTLTQRLRIVVEQPSASSPKG